LTPEGEALQSGYAGELEMPRYGNIREMAIAKILQNERKEEFVRTVQELRNSSCADCRFWDLCHESPPQPTPPRDATLMFRTQWCETRIRFIEDFFQPVTGARFEPSRH
jgi:radical SAM protein with 4Fe4S-binding SPASM domain